MAQNRQELVRQAAQQHARELAELPVWQHAFVLGPNVRFTRTPENALPKRPHAETVAETETVSQHEIPMSVGQLEQMTAQPFMATMTVDHTPDLTRAYVDAKAAQRVSPAVLAATLAATAAPGARALVSELQREFSGQAPMSPVPQWDGTLSPADMYTQNPTGHGSMGMQHHAGSYRPMDAPAATDVSQAEAPHSEPTVAVAPRPTFKPSGLPPLLYKRPAPKPQAETPLPAETVPTVAAPVSTIAPITVPPTVPSDFRPLAMTEPTARPTAESGPAPADKPSLPSIVNLPDHLLWEVMSLGLAANDDSAPPAPAPIALPRRVSAASTTAVSVQAHAPAAAAVQPALPSARNFAATATMPRAYFNGAAGTPDPAAAAPQVPFGGYNAGSYNAYVARTAVAPPVKPSPAALIATAVATAAADEGAAVLRYRAMTLRAPTGAVPVAEQSIAASPAGVSPLAVQPPQAQTAALIVPPVASFEAMPAVAEQFPPAPVEHVEDAVVETSPSRPVVQKPASMSIRPQRRPATLMATLDVAMPDADDYDYPSPDLLQEPRGQQATVMTQEMLEQSAGLLESVLEDFGIKGEIVDVRSGPVVTLYEFEPAPGVKSSRVIGLSDDIARSMSALSARVAVVPGRNVIGIELPNPVRETVYFRELIESEPYVRTGFRLPLCLGKTIGGEPVIADLAKMPHLLVAGTTGSGKSVSVNTMILSLLYRMRPDECRLIMVDPKMLELSIYDGIPHLLTPVVTDPKKAVLALKWAVREMEDRYRKMSRLGVRNIDGYNVRVATARQKEETITISVPTGFDRATGETVFEDQALDLSPLPYIVIIVDEMADLMMVAGKDIEGAIQRLAQMARAAGIHLIMATQRPSVDVITGTIKANFPTRISFQVTSKIDSRTILGEQGAENLLGQGDMLHMMGGGRIARVHGPFVSDQEVEGIVAHLKMQGRPEYLGTVTEDTEEAPAKDEDAAVFDKSAMGEEDGDDLYERAVKVVLRDKKCSTSYIQRRLSVGYNRAASLVERMEQEGLVGPANHVGKRSIIAGGGDGGAGDPSGFDA
ncbi:MAG: DNA translocase FtsK [Neorhizobium sp.]|nr:DNA translocase FtsK [Neorhizobium sp.]